jgi:hypothetical protein
VSGQIPTEILIVASQKRDYSIPNPFTPGKVDEYIGISIAWDYHSRGEEALRFPSSEYQSCPMGCIETKGRAHDTSRRLAGNR